MFKLRKKDNFFFHNIEKKGIRKKEILLFLVRKRQGAYIKTKTRRGKLNQSYLDGKALISFFVLFPHLQFYNNERYTLSSDR
jgi:hypothetical protein